MDNQPKTRSIKILLCWMDGTPELRYYRLINPNPDEVTMLRLAHGIFLDQTGTDYVNPECEKAIKEIGFKCGSDLQYEVDLTEMSEHAILNQWLDSRIHEKQIADFMGWDRVIITGFSDF